MMLGRPIAGLMVLGVLLGACGSSDDATNSSVPSGETAAASTDVTVAPPSDPMPGGKLLYGLDGESQGFNPATSTFAPATMVVGNAVFDPLMAIDAEGELRPYLAESLEPNADHTQWTITLRPDITFHNGEALDAAAVAGFLDAVRASPLVGSSANPIEAVTVVDDLTVQIDLALSWAALPWLFAGQVGLIPAPAMLDDPDGARSPIGTGPFVFRSWTPDNNLKLDRNSSYWREGLPYLEEIEFRPLPDTTSRLAALDAGDVNMIHAIEPALKTRLDEAASGGEIQIVRATGEGQEVFVMLNTERIPDLRVRQAMGYAIETQAILDAVGVTSAATGPFAPDSRWYTSVEMPNSDAERAKALVDEVEAESGPISVRLGALPNPESSELSQLVGQAWTEVGIEVQLEAIEQSAYIVKAVTGDYDATLFRQFGSPDPDSDSVFWHSDQATGSIALNMPRNKDAELDQALFVGRTSPDEAVRKQAYATVQERFVASLPYLWLYHTSFVVAADNETYGIATQTLPDGTRANTITNGANRLTEVWRG